MVEAFDALSEALIHSLESDLNTSRGREARLTAIQTALFRIAEADSRERLSETLCDEVIPLFKARRAAIIDVSGRVLFFEDLHDVECELTRDEATSFGWSVVSGSAADLDSPFFEVTDCYALAPLTRDKEVGALWLFLDGMKTVADQEERELGGIANFAGVVYANVAFRELLQQQSMSDPLTGIPNRRALEERLRRAIQAREPFTYYLIDLDNFKKINDTYGHSEGDNVLIRCAHALRDAVRSQDMAARFAGDEFAVVVDGEDTAVGERVHGALRGAKIEASIGRAMFPTDGVSEKAVFEAADARMFESKKENHRRHGDDATRTASPKRPT